MSGAHKPPGGTITPTWDPCHADVTDTIACAPHTTIGTESTDIAMVAVRLRSA
jgi:hypothetical protein